MLDRAFKIFPDHKGLIFAYISLWPRVAVQHKYFRNKLKEQVIIQSMSRKGNIDYYTNERIQVKTKWIPPVKYRKASMC